MKPFIPSICIFLLIGCLTEINKTNDTTDQNAAMGALNDYYAKMKTKEYYQCVGFFDTAMFQVKSKDSLVKEMKFVESKLGAYQEHEFTSVATSTKTINNVKEGRYDVACSVKRDSGKTYEKFILEFKENKKPKITSISVTTALR
jgi:hypothetical protein